MMLHRRGSTRRAGDGSAGWRRAAVLLAVAAGTAVLPVQAWGDDYSRWYTLELRGRRAGWLHATQRTSEGEITTAVSQRLRLKRGGDVLELSCDSTFVETSTGVPLSMRLSESLGAAPITREYRFNENSVEAVTILGLGREPRRETLPINPPGGTWLTPAAAAQFLEQRLAAGAREIVLRTPDLDLGPAPVLWNLRVNRRIESVVMEKPVSGYELSVAPAVAGAVGLPASLRLVDERGVIVQAETELGGLGLRIRLCDQAAAEAPFEPADFTDVMVVQPDRVVPGARKTTSAEYLITLPKPAGDKDEPRATGSSGLILSGSIQTAEATDEGGIRVRIDTSAGSPAPAEEVSDARYSDASILIDSSDPDVMRLSRQAVNGIGTHPLAEQAEAMRRYVNTYVTRESLGVGLAAASEVARTRTGDCTEHAVLLAAMLRASGIPSRVVIGLAYTDSLGQARGVFVHHMWTQALIEFESGPRWVDLDATMDSLAAVDATHIALSYAALEDTGSLEPLRRTLRLIDELKIRVIDVR